MRRVPLAAIVLSGLRAHAGRLLLTAAAIAGGVGFLTGTFVYADTAKAAFYDGLARSARNVDVVVLPPEDEFLARVEPGTVDALRQLPELAQVDAREMELLGMLDRQGKLISNYGQPGYAISLPATPELARFDLVSGRLADRAGEVDIDRSTADRYGLVVGGPVTMITDDGTTSAMTIVGLLDFGVHRQLSGFSVAAMTPGDLGRLVKTKGAAEVVARAAPGVSQEQARQAVSARLPSGYRALTGDQWREELAVAAAKYVDGFHQVLLGFSLISLAVSVFVIYNTFAILTARRARELALWRCLGATRAQVRRFVLAEALVLGVLGSLAGLGVSLAIGWGLVTGRSTVGTTVPEHSLVLRPLSIALTVGVGTLTALIAAFLPAWRAGRIPPMAALQAAPLLDSKPGRLASFLRILCAAGLMLAGAVLSHFAPSGFDGLKWIFGGAAVFFSGLVLAAPLVVGRVTALVGWLPGKIFGPVARLAMRQSRHQPRRAAATTSALMVGVGVLATISVLLTTAEDQSRKELNENFAVDFQLTSSDVQMGNGKSHVPAALLDKLRQRPEFSAVTGARRDLALVENSGVYVWSEREFTAPLVPEIVEGDLGKLGPGTVVIHDGLADQKNLQLGDTIQIDDLKLTVVAIYDDSPVDGSALLSWEGYASLRGQADPDTVLISLADGVSPAQGQEALDAALAAYPLVQVSGKAQSREELTQWFDRLLGVLTALLAVALIIALVGIGNTLALSVWERTRESATLRALGLSRGGLRGMLLTEAMLMALVGGGAGVLFGGAVGWYAAKGIIAIYGHGSPTLPWHLFALYVVVAALAGAVAALLPARRAARASIVDALAAE